MKEHMVIKGIGCINALGATQEEIWTSLDSDEKEYEHMKAYPFETYLKGSEKRRTTRQADMTLYVCEKAKEQYLATGKELNASRTGTVFSSDCGPLNQSLAFARQVEGHEPALCSPSLFTNTVANALLSNTCIRNGYTAASTMLLESNALSYSIDLLEEGKADNIFCGYIEEYCPQLFESLNGLYKGKYDFAESATAFLVGKEDGGPSLCKILSLEEANIGSDPWNVENNSDEIKEIVKDCIEASIKESGVKSPDAVILTEEGTEVFKISKELIKNYNHIEGLKVKLGETGGANFFDGLATASLIIRKGRIPKSLTHKNEKAETILVTGISRIGNYYAAVIQKS